MHNRPRASIEYPPLLRSALSTTQSSHVLRNHHKNQAARKDGDRHMTGVIRAEGGAVKREAGEEMEVEEEEEDGGEGENGVEEQAAEVKEDTGDGKVLVGAGSRMHGAKKPKI